MTERRLTITGEGIVLGTTVLAKFVDGGLCMDEAKVLSLLSVVYGQCVSPSVARNFHAAAKSYKEGDETIALMHLALTGLPALHKMDQVQLLSEADDFLNSGRTPLALLKFCGIENILDCPVAQELYKFVTKYNPYHLGTGPGGGQFTTQARDVASAIIHPSGKEMRVVQNDTTRSDAANNKYPDEGVEPVYPIENAIVFLAGGAAGQAIRGARTAASLIEGAESTENTSGNDASVERSLTTENGTLANSENAVIDSSNKIDGYALNPNHPKGADKSVVFDSVLGYNQSNSEGLVQQIRDGITNYPAVADKTDQFGARFYVDIPVTGPNGNTANVRTTWIYDPGSNTPRLTSLRVQK